MTDISIWYHHSHHSNITIHQHLVKNLHKPEPFQSFLKKYLMMNDGNLESKKLCRVHPYHQCFLYISRVIVYIIYWALFCCKHATEHLLVCRFFIFFIWHHFCWLHFLYSFCIRMSQNIAQTYELMNTCIEYVFRNKDVLRHWHRSKHCLSIKVVVSAQVTTEKARVKRSLNQKKRLWMRMVWKEGSRKRKVRPFIIFHCIPLSILGKYGTMY